MPHSLALTVEIVTTALTVAGIGYFVAVWVAALGYVHSRRRAVRNLQQNESQFAPGVSVLKSLKGLDPDILNAFRSHCTQIYRGEFELLFGVASLDDPAAAAVELLQREFPQIAILLVECPLQLGTNGKVSTLVQLMQHARYEVVLINDSDISVSPHYLERVVAAFEFDEPHRGKSPVGLVTSLYRGRAHGSLWRGGLPARLESMGISTDFMPAVLLARVVERGLHYGLGSTLAVRRGALEAIGGLLPLVDQLADDYELGARIAGAGFRVELCADVVETGVPEYNWRGFIDHQLRWFRTVRDARPGGYAGLLFTHGIGWATLNVVASGLSPLSFWLVAMSFFLRLTVAMTVGAEVLFDRQVLAHLWLLPVRDVISMGLWVAGFTGNTIIWRGERFVLKAGKLEKHSTAVRGR